MFFKALDYPVVIIDSEYESPRLRGTIIRALAEELENSNQRVMANLTLDDALVAREQKIADVLFEAGAIPRKIDVNVEFYRGFNAATVGGN